MSDFNSGGSVNTMSEFENVCAKLNKKYGVIWELCYDINRAYKCIYFQDPYMKDIFNFYPDRLCIDFTYKYEDLFLYIFSCSDSNGVNEIVSLAITLNETAESFLWIMNAFKKHNPNYRKIKILAIDPEIKRCDDIRNIFPSPYLIICFHHAYKSFKKGLESLYAPNVCNVDPKKYAAELFRMMYNARNQAEYEIYYQQFLTLPSSVVFYFNEGWLPSIHLWRIGLDFVSENIYTSLNAFLENLDNTAKLLFITDNITHFLERFYSTLSLSRNENKNLILCSDHELYSKYSTEYHICEFLTPFASKLVIDQLHLASEIHMDCSVLSDNYYFDNVGSLVSATISMCQCRFYLYTFLPCRHIFAVRKTLSVSPFDDMLIDCTWTKKYYESSKKSVKETLSAINNLNLPDFSSKQKFVSEQLQNVLPSLFASSHVLDSRRDILKQLIDLWKNDKEVYLEFDGIEPKFSIQDTACCAGTSEEYILSKPDISHDKILPSLSNSNTIDSEKSAKIIHSSSKLFKKQYANTVVKNNHNIGSSDEDGLPTLGESSYQRNFNFKSRSLDGSHINFAFLCRIICSNKESIIDWLKQMELICTSMLCPTCGCGMTMKFVPRLSDGTVWICLNDVESKKSCSRRCPVRRGSWFELTNMSFEQILTFCYMWIRGFSQSQIISETGISTATYISWNKLNRRVCEECLSEDENYSAVLKQVDSTSCSQVLELWLQKCKGEDPFLKFLQDANAMHRKDAVKHSMG